MLHSINYCMCVFLKFICIYFFLYYRGPCVRKLFTGLIMYLPSQNKEHCIVLYCIVLYCRALGSLHIFLEHSLANVGESFHNTKSIKNTYIPVWKTPAHPYNSFHCQDILQLTVRHYLPARRKKKVIKQVKTLTGTWDILRPFSPFNP